MHHGEGGSRTMPQVALGAVIVGWGRVCFETGQRGVFHQIYVHEPSPLRSEAYILLRIQKPTEVLQILRETWTHKV